MRMIDFYTASNFLPGYIYRAILLLYIFPIKLVSKIGNEVNFAEQQNMAWNKQSTV